MKSDNGQSPDSEVVSGNVIRKVSKKAWEPMKLTYAGEAKDIVRGGSGKEIVSDADPGDVNKPKGQK